MSRLAAHLAGAAAVVAVALAVTATPAEGHVALLRSEPEARATLEVAPDEVVLFFSEAPDPEISRVLVFDRTGAEVDHGAMEILDVPEHVRVPLPSLDDGVYTVSWQALSLVDGHVTSGAFSFVVGEASGADLDDAAAAVEADPRSSLSPPGVAGRWLLYSGLALLLGWAVTTLGVFRGAVAASGWVLLACWIMAVVGLTLLAVAEANSVDISVGTLLGSSAGIRLLRVGVLLAVVGVTVVIAAVRPHRIAAGVVAIAAVAALFTHAAAGHAGAPGGGRWLQLGSQWLHMVGVGAWIGGLVWLLLGTRAQSNPDRVAPVTRFSNLATVALGLVVATGAVRALGEFPTLADLWSTDYGVSFLVKLSLVLVLIALGAVNRLRNVPAIARGESHHRSLRQVVRGEVVFAAGVFLVTGILASTPPPELAAEQDEHAGMDGHDMGDDAGGIVVSGNDFGTSIRVTLTVDPGAIGPNRFAVDVVDYDTEEPVEASNVMVDFALPERGDVGASRLEFEPTDGGTWQAEGTALAQPGHWRATVIITIGSDGYEIPLEFDLGTDATDADAESDAHDGEEGDAGAP